jgi:hypothetical protein
MGRRITSSAAAAVAALVMLAGCSDDKDDVTTGSTTVDGSDASTATTSDGAATESTTDGSEPASTDSVVPPTTGANAVVSTINQPGEGEYEGALQDVTDSSCEPIEGVWTYVAAATNPTDAVVEYRIFVSFLDPAGETLASLQAENAIVEPGASADFSVEFPSDVEGLQCVPRVERRTQ